MQEVFIMKRRKRKRSAAYKPHTTTQETTMQMPFGPSSVFHAVETNILTPAEGITLAFHYFHSHWDSGRTRPVSITNVQKALDISRSYVRRLLKRLRAWMAKIKVIAGGTMYKLKTHLFNANEVPEDEQPFDENGKPLKFAVAIGEGGPFDRLCQHHISWQATWVWLVLKRYSIWDPKDERTGQTFPANYALLCKRTGLSRSILCRSIKQLENAGMLERLSLPHAKSVFQLYPKPRLNPTPRPRPAADIKSPRRDADHWYSLNEKYRIRIDDGAWELKRQGRWVAANRDRVPTLIKEELEKCREMSFSLTKGSSHSSMGSAHNDTDSAHNVTPFANQPPEGIPRVPSQTRQKA